MSQTSDAMARIDKHLGFEILRPLSAKLLKETQAEKKGLVDRSKFLEISGRRRDVQMSLAKKYNIKFPSPAGGCLLCEKNYAPRLRDLFIHNKTISPEHIQSLDGFRHFRKEGKIILGRNHQENLKLQALNKKLGWNIFSPENIPGPTAIFDNKKDKKLAEDMVKAYSSGDLKKRKKFDKLSVSFSA
jgi:hypothetical protein